MDLDRRSVNTLKGIALRHWEKGGAALRVGQSQVPESIYNNPELYPQMFPWLFPYGLGGIGSCRMSEKKHKRHLLMYHDKRFQRDVNFPFVAFSHSQIKSTTSSGFLLAEKSKFHAISQRLLNVDQHVLSSLAKRMSEGEIVKPDSPEEKACFQIIRDLDHVAGRVEGSITKKKYMRNEIWSLIASQGAPSWYITLSPADSKHPISLYFADTGETFVPAIRAQDDRFRLIASNPVAAARFFHFMIQTFIEHVLGYKKGGGLYGDPSAYYGTVEQQGRLTLHLHLLLWLKGGLTPDEVRKRLLNPQSEFLQKLTDYLESVHSGDFNAGSKEDAFDRLDADKASATWTDPTESLPVPPPPPCSTSCGNCDECHKLSKWRGYFKFVVDDILAQSNVHKCGSNKKLDGSQNKKKNYVGCLDNIWGKCKARFPRPLFKKTEVDAATGSLNIKKNEPWINTYTPAVTYLFRCNTDVTSLRSGTAIKGVLLYVSDYVTKQGLKTHVIFDSIRSIFHKNNALLSGDESQVVKARKLMTKMVNRMSAQMEFGSPMISMYLLGNPDHYTSHHFMTFYWQSFVQEVQNAWGECGGDAPNKVALLVRKDSVVGISLVDDYMCRSIGLEGMSLYDWISRCKREKITRRKSAEFQVADINNDNQPSDDNPDHEYISDNDDDRFNAPSKWYTFTEHHPLFKTHRTRCISYHSRAIPNFVGATLPRCDHGDREYYCLTMLTLFKPWRTGLELKSDLQTWDEAFLTHTFNPREVTLMSNFNIRYECLDAKDDFHAQMKSGNAGLPSWAFNDGGVINDFNQVATSDEQAYDMLPEDVEISEQCGRQELARKNAMACMSAVMAKLRWNEPGSKFPKGFESNPISPKVVRNAGEWKSLIAKKRREVLDKRAQNIPHNRKIDQHGQLNKSESSTFNDVMIVTKAYLQRSCKSPGWDNVIGKVSSDFGLNAEQNRAFRIVVHHACDPTAEQLKMYIGGMGGTGKSRVFKALMEFFNQRNERHRFVAVAPTGSAAALLGGSTYHFMFGINETTDTISNNMLAEVRTRLEGVDYIFFDEVSMLSCRDMYRISSRLAILLDDPDKPFGGLNMIFSGDFGQLPPVIGHEAAALYSRTVGRNSKLRSNQEAAIGKALWHQITTVVILRQNMRQNEQTVKDVAFRTALENMRYRSCTTADIIFLRSLVSSEAPGRISVCNEDFRNVSIITSLNVHKDTVNRLGSERFATETGQILQDFFSEDTVSSKDERTHGKKRLGKGGRNLALPTIHDDVQEVLWNQPHSANTKLVPGRLSLCVGLPVMIRYNAATELGITKGQEGIVHAWQSTLGSRKRRILEVLFVKLTDPPQDVQFDGLPLNVVPITPNNVNTICSLPDDSTVCISRKQVEVLPNFSMTDYASQGKTRLFNVVDINNSRSHQSYYTALSRGTSAARTVILQGFDCKKITGGASGALRQEFRELELLDNITSLRYRGKLPVDFWLDGELRNNLIKRFRVYKGEDYMPQTLHKAVRWSPSDPFLDSSLEHVKWEILNPPRSLRTTSDGLSTVTPNIENRSPSSFSALDHDNPLKHRPAKRKISGEMAVNKVPLKKRCLSECRETLPSSQSSSILNPQGVTMVPLGTRWSNNSCAYDTVVCILYAVWCDNIQVRSRQLSDQNPTFLGDLSDGFARCVVASNDGSSPVEILEEVRDSLRQSLLRYDGNEFPWGGQTSVDALLAQILATPTPVAETSIACSYLHASRPTRVTTSRSCHITVARRVGSLQEVLDTPGVETTSYCPDCNNCMVRTVRFCFPPPVLSFEICFGVHQLDEELRLQVGNVVHLYKLRGVIYHGGAHFTARLVTLDRLVWFHDGIATGTVMQYDGYSTTVHDMHTCRGKTAIAAVYAL